MKPQIECVALDVLTLRFGEQVDEDTLPWLTAAAQRLREQFGAALIDLVPAYTTLMLHYDCRLLDEQAARHQIQLALHELRPSAPTNSGDLHRIPVWYDPSVGPDLAGLAAHTGLDASQLIERHGARDYSVFALGFVPGFAYMGLLEPALAAPRLATPRQRVAVGSVGVAERQTAIYPSASPGGWRIIGRTPVRLFDQHAVDASLLKPGDRVRFEAIDRDTFVQLGGDTTPLEG
ncbi:MAG: 5-oxoprolinase subunit PxpB [Pseudomonas sp.]